MRVGVLQKASMPLFLSCEFAVIDIYAKEACLSFTVNEVQIMDSTWFLAAAQTMDIHMVSSVSIGQGPQHGFWWQYRPWT